MPKIPDYPSLDPMADDDLFVVHNVASSATRNVTRLAALRTLPDGVNPSLRSVTVYTSNDTWNKPAEMVDGAFIIVKAQAGGGAGGWSSSTGSSQGSYGSGGEGGGYSEKKIAAADLSSTEAIAIGVGGNSTTSTAPAGGNTTFGSTKVVAVGGAGGNTMSASGVAGQGADGGSSNQLTSAVGDLKLPGEPGGNSFRDNSFRGYGGRGGNSKLGFGASATPQGSTSGSVAGVNGRVYGGGGSGAGASASQSATAGGDGAQGVLIVEVYY